MTTPEPVAAPPASSPAPTPAVDQDARVAALEVEVAALRSQRDAAWAQVESMRHSASWRLTWPLRRLSRLLRTR